MPFPLDETTHRFIRQHFDKKRLVWEENYFLNILKTSEKKHDIYWSVLALRDCGTTRAVPLLKEKLDYPMNDVQATALLTIAHIARAAETPLYADTLLNPAYRQKTFAMWAICDAADERAVDTVLTYFAKNLGKLKNGQLVNASATLADGLEYLQRHESRDKRILPFFQQVQSFWQKRPEREREEIIKRVQYFRNI